MTETTASPRWLLLPGWLNSEPAHWQSRWEALHEDRRVEQDDWRWPRRGDWMARLDEVMLESDQPAVLVAHSLGCHLVAAWAARSQHTHRVRAALLVAPPDTERDDMPPNLFNWRPLVRAPLPFASLVVTSSDDPFCSTARAADLACDWRSQVLEIGARGHVNAASGLGDWPEGRRLLGTLLASLPPTPAAPPPTNRAA
jgi:predicted alpha/beta hydrolase family esterase